MGYIYKQACTSYKLYNYSTKLFKLDPDIIVLSQNIGGYA